MFELFVQLICLHCLDLFKLKDNPLVEFSHLIHNICVYANYIQVHKTFLKNREKPRRLCIIICFWKVIKHACNIQLKPKLGKFSYTRSAVCHSTRKLSSFPAQNKQTYI